MGGRKQGSISNITSFFKVPSTAVSDSSVDNQPNIKPSNQNLHNETEARMASAQVFIPPTANEHLHSIDTISQDETANIPDKVIHPFFNKDARIAVQIQKTKQITPKILSSEKGGKVTKPQKRGRKRKDLSTAETAILADYGSNVDVPLEHAADLDGDFPTPSSTGSNDFEAPEIETLGERKPRLEHQDLVDTGSIPSPPRSSEYEPQDVSIQPLNSPASKPSIPSNGPMEGSAISPPVAQNENATAIIHGENQVSTDTNPAEPWSSLPPAVRSAFDVMKKSSASATKIRSRSMSPTPLDVEEPPPKKVRTRGRPRKSAPGTVNLNIEAPVSFEHPVISSSKPSLVVKLCIGKEAAAQLGQPPPPRKSLVVKLKIDKVKLEAITPKPHPFFQKKRVAPAGENTSKPGDAEKTIPVSKPVTKGFLFQRETKPKFKVELSPAWPTHFNTHVRSIGVEEQLPVSLAHAVPSILSSKGKIRKSDISMKESALELLRRNFSNLYVNHAYHVDDNGPPVPQPTIRIPEPRVLGASEVLNFIIAQLPTSCRLYSENTHPAIRQLVDRIGNQKTVLTAFDRGDCEAQNWCSIYAPTSSDCVLQTGQEAMELSRWLGCMKITAVDTGTGLSKPKVPQVKKKKKPKHELDDFIVSEDDENDSMDELTDPEDIHELLPNLTSKILLKKSEIRHRSRSAVRSVATNSAIPGSLKLANAILISGPSGIGKTASVYAAAKEHDFVVFEINPGTKRGGKEIQEMVGDMSRNHLVHQAKTSEQIIINDTAGSKPASNLVASFLKKDPSKANVQGNTQADGTKEKEKVKQQQSLILIEEADILFEEDKGFWSSVITLIEKSRRPVVITCNDESRLPLDDLALYAKLRFKPASLDLAAKYLTVLSAAQGHLIDREVLQELYEGCNYDLRRAITQLSFWCQMALGDRTWCGKWFYSRNDPDHLNERTLDGQIKRCVSRGTYIRGMDAFGRELLIGAGGKRLRPEEYDEVAVWKDVADTSDVDLGDRFYHEGLTHWMRAANNKDSLSAYSDYIDSLSLLDAYGGVSSYSSEAHLQRIDARPSSLKDKRSPDNLLEMKILDAEKKPDPLSTSSLLSITGQILSRNVLQSQTAGIVTGCKEIFANYEESDIVRMISNNRQFRMQHQAKEPEDLRCPFDRIMHGHTQLIRPISILVETIPYIREVARFDIRNEEEAKYVSSLISQRPGGKTRKTRASAFASEGRSRGGGRPKSEQYFRGNLREMIQTGGQGWGNAVDHVMGPVLSTLAEMEDGTDSDVQDGNGRVTMETVDTVGESAVRADEARRERRRVIDDDIEDGSSDC